MEKLSCDHENEMLISPLLSGMDKRSIAIAERRAAREQRKEALLKEKEEQMAREEQEKQQAELAAKEALIQQRKEKRRLAKQVSSPMLLSFMHNSFHSCVFVIHYVSILASNYNLHSLLVKVARI